MADLRHDAPRATTRPAAAPERLTSAQRIILLGGVAAAIAAGVTAWRVTGRNGTAPRDVCSYRKYDERSGQLRFMLCDVDRNGRVDTLLVTPPDGTHTLEFDANEDGLIDRADVYDANQVLVTVAYDRRPDGSFARVERVNQPGGPPAEPADQPELPAPSLSQGSK